MVALQERMDCIAFPAERRVFGRATTQATARGRRLDHSLAACRQRVVDLDVRDVSLTGVSALCDVPMENGERLFLAMPGRQGLPGWEAFGRVLRCEPSLDGYRVAVEFDRLPAA